MGGVVGGRRSNLANAYSDSPPDPVAGELDLQVQQVLPGGLGFGCGLLVLLLGFLLGGSYQLDLHGLAVQRNSDVRCLSCNYNNSL